MVSNSKVKAVKKVKTATDGNGRGKCPGGVMLNGRTSGGKVTLFTVQLLKANFIESMDEFEADPANRNMVREYAATLDFSGNARYFAVLRAIKRALKVVPSLHLAD
jgi:hypothetical protein